MKLQTLALFSLVTVAIGGVGWVFLYPLLSGERQAERRRASVARADPAARLNGPPQKTRREHVEETLKDLDVRAQRPTNLPLHMRIAQAGLDWSRQRFLMIAGALGAFGFFAAYLIGAG